MSGVRRVPLVATLALAYEIVRGDETSSGALRRRLLLEIQAVERRSRIDTVRPWRAELRARDWAAANRPELLSEWRAAASDTERPARQAEINSAYRKSGTGIDPAQA